MPDAPPDTPAAAAQLSHPNEKPSTPTAKPERFVFKPELLERVGLSYPSIWALMRAGKFPRSRVIAGGTRVAWLASEIDAWIASRPPRQLLGDADGVPGPTPQSSKDRRCPHRSRNARRGRVAADPET